MNRFQFMLALAVMAGGSVGGSFLAVQAMQPEIAQAQEKKVVSGSEFRLVDDNGKLRSLMTVDKNGDLLFTMLDAQEKVRMTQSVGNDGSSAVVLSAADGKPRMSLTSDSKQPGAFTVFDSKGDAAAVLAIGSDDFPMLTLNRDKNSVLTGITKDGKGLIAMSDGAGQYFSVTGGGDMASALMLNHTGSGSSMMMTSMNDGTMQLSLKEKDALLSFLTAGAGKTSAFQLEHSEGSVVYLQAQKNGSSVAQMGSGAAYTRVMQNKDGSAEYAIIKDKKYAWKETGSK